MENIEISGIKLINRIDKILFEMIDAISRVYDQHGISFSMKEEDMNKILGDLYGRD